MNIYVIYIHGCEGTHAIGIAPTIELACNEVLEVHKNSQCETWFIPEEIPEDDILHF